MAILKSVGVGATTQAKQDELQKLLSNLGEEYGQDAWFVDTHAGPGRYEGINGSPLIVHPLQFRNHVLIERDERVVRALNRVLRQHLLEPLVVCGDCNTALPRIIKMMGSGARGIIYSDPCGIGIPWEVLQKSPKGVDILLNLQIRVFSRHKRNKELMQQLNGLNRHHMYITRNKGCWDSALCFVAKELTPEKLRAVQGLGMTLVQDDEGGRVCTSMERLHKVFVQMPNASAVRIAKVAGVSKDFVYKGIQGLRGTVPLPEDPREGRKRRRPLTTEEIRSIKKLWEAGEPSLRICERYSIGKSTMYHVLSGARYAGKE